MKEGQRQTVLGSDATYPGMPIVSRDGTLAIYPSGNPRRYFIVPTRPTLRAAMTRIACQACDPLWDLTADNRAIVYTRAAASIQVRDLATGTTRQLTAASGDIIGRLRLSPDDRWLFHEARRSMAILPLPSRGLGLSRSRLVVSLAESAGNVWLAK